MEEMLQDMERTAAVATAEKVNARLEALDDHVTMLKAMGVGVSITLDAPTTRPLDKIEKVGSTKEVGWYAYVDFLDEEGTRRRIDAARAAAAYVAGGQ